MTHQNKEGLDLLPCPFCGSRADAVNIPNFRGVECSTCGADIGADPKAWNADTRDASVWISEATEAWNRRVHDPIVSSLREENERLRKEKTEIAMTALAADGQAQEAFVALSASQAQLKIYREALEAFVNVRDQFPESAKLIDTRFDGHQPISVTVTLDQFRAAHTALSQNQEQSDASS